MFPAIRTCRYDRNVDNRKGGRTSGYNQCFFLSAADKLFFVKTSEINALTIQRIIEIGFGDLSDAGELVNRYENSVGAHFRPPVSVRLTSRG
jgi:hypothetical protein